jgi:hypothetical protein
MVERTNSENHIESSKIIRLCKNLDIIKGRLERSPLPPWWKDELVSLNPLIRDFLSGNLNVTPSVLMPPERKTLVYYRDLQDALSSNAGGRFNYFEHREQFFAGVARKSYPDKPNPSINQLGIQSWWIGERSGSPVDDVIENIRRISSSQKEDIPQQFREGSIRDPFKRKIEPDPRQIEKVTINVQKLGEKYSRFDVESQTVYLQQVWRDITTKKLQFKNTLSIRASRKVDDSYNLSIRGVDPRRSEDKVELNFLPGSKANVSKDFMELVSNASDLYSPGMK